MSWGSASEFFGMGGYGLHVWGSYAVTMGVLLAEVALLGAKERGITRRLRAHTFRGTAS